ncbi:zinc finger protein 296-like [Varroa destructor]|uniref:C2H2-type domain-containing protein n=2 Tax=Varroa TaxID=62624 RepID=A0A7M7IX00_VARDE|nr:zinc finger protein 296-like [Varroa destructor]
MPPPPIPPSAGGAMLRRFLCRFCGYIATSAGNRDKHERVHTGEKTIQCGYCEYATADTSNYNRHLRRKHGVEPEGPGALPPGVIGTSDFRGSGVLESAGDAAGIQCPYCPYGTANVADFDRHVRIRHNGGD